MESTGLFTDRYELTMAQGYFLNGQKDIPVRFDYFFRTNPFGGGYTIFAGLSSLLDEINAFTYPREDIDFLRAEGFHEDFLAYLQDFKPGITLHAVQEGEVVFPLEPILSVEGTLIEAQLLETLILNTINFQSLIATKASRIRQVIGNERLFVDFGLRRAQGKGGIEASKAILIGGANSTSNMDAGKRFQLPTSGTMAHSWVQSFPTELEAFQAFVKYYPEQSILLIDTYNTLKSGLPNAIKVGLEMKKAGQKLLGVRLDSGDLAYLSKLVRKELDANGLTNVNIVVSNQLDEYLIKSLNDQKAPIDAFGVGTSLITGKADAALDGVYKLSTYNHQPTLKISDNLAKTTLPGKKQVVRYKDTDGTFIGDAILLQEEPLPEKMIHPYEQEQAKQLDYLANEPLMKAYIHQGQFVAKPVTVQEMQDFRHSRLASLPEEHKRFEYPHVYQVGLSPQLWQLRKDIIRSYK